MAEPRWAALNFGLMVALAAFAVVIGDGGAVRRRGGAVRRRGDSESTYRGRINAKGLEAVENATYGSIP